MSYRAFAEFYDTFTVDVGYRERAEYMLSLFERFDRIPSLLLDVGCGTGNFTYEFAAKGIDVIGVDPSAEMLSVAASKSQSANAAPLFLQQSAENLELYGTVDGAVACLECVNHILDYEALVRSFSGIALFLEPERLFIFDANTVYKHRKVLSGKKFLYDSGDKLCIWKNSRCSRNNTVKMKLKLSAQNDDGGFCCTDTNAERAYTVAQLTDALEQAGMKVLAVFGDMSYAPPSPNEERIYVIAERMI